MEQKPKSKKTKGTIYLIPSELYLGTGGQTLSGQAIAMLKELTLFAVEDVRTTRRFISSLKLGVDIESLQFIELSKKTTPYKLKSILHKVLQGESLGILSEAGCPGIADPGGSLVALAHEAKITVVPLSGPSSFVLALMASGLSGQRFAFHGYLPIPKGERQKAILALEKRSRENNEAEIFMETPYRNDSMLEEILQSCAAHTKLCVAADLTGPNEIIYTRTIEVWKKKTIKLHKIPTVFILQAD